MPDQEGMKPEQCARQEAADSELLTTPGSAAGVGPGKADWPTDLPLPRHYLAI